MECRRPQNVICGFKEREREREREREGKSKETAPRRLPNFLSFFFLVLEIDKASWIIFLFYNIYIHI
jgi:hypothetical protein